MTTTTTTVSDIDGDKSAALIKEFLLTADNNGVIRSTIINAGHWTLGAIFIPMAVKAVKKVIAKQSGSSGNVPKDVTSANRRLEALNNA